MNRKEPVSVDAIGRMRRAETETPKVCLSCGHARQKFVESCYCVLYGIIIGYSKTECRGWKREQVREPEDGTGRDHV